MRRDLLPFNEFMLEAALCLEGARGLWGLGSFLKNGWNSLSSAFSSSTKATSLQAAKGGANLTKFQLKSISSFESQIATHQTKLSEYIKNPMKFDNKGFLKNAPNDAVRQKIIQSRINHLNQEINTFKNNIQKIINGQ